MLSTWIVTAVVRSCHPHGLHTVAGPVVASGVLHVNVSTVAGAWLAGCGKLYASGSALSGIMIVCAMGLFSRIAMAMMLCGALVGLLTGWAMDASVAQLLSGSWGSDAALTAIAIGGMFCAWSLRVAVLALCAACSAAMAQCALTHWLAFAAVPNLNAGFNLTCILFILIKPSLSIAAIPFAEMSRPEGKLC